MKHENIIIDPAPRAQTCSTPHQKLSGACELLSFHDICQIDTINGDIKRDLAGGASALQLNFPPANKAELAMILEGVDLNYIPVGIIAGDDALATCQTLLDYYAQKNIANHQVKLNLNATVKTTDDDVKGLCSLTQAYENIRLMLVDGAYYHLLGANPAYELAFMLADGVKALRKLENAGLSVAEAAKKINFQIATDADLFANIAKLRAFRLLWGQVLLVAGVNAGVKGIAAHIEAHSAQRMYQEVDEETNILRATAAAFAAMLGGADRLAILPHNYPTSDKNYDPKARRIARNIAVILDEEGFLTRTHDAGAGSYSIETLTHQFAEGGWEIFTQIEAIGEISDDEERALIAEWFAPISAKRFEDIQSGERIIIGVNGFKNDLQENGEKS